MTDWVETYFPTTEKRSKRSGAALRRVLTAAVFTTVIAGSLFVSLARAPLNQTAFGGAFTGMDFVRALDLNSIEPASGVGDPDRMGQEKAAQLQGPKEPPPDFMQASSTSTATQSGEHQVQAVLVAQNIAVILMALGLPRVFIRTLMHINTTPLHPMQDSPRSTLSSSISTTTLKAGKPHSSFQA